jgi:2-oxoglutarate dehydrogenase E1 component
LKSIEAAFGPNSALVEELYEQYEQDPETVPDHWRQYFDEKLNKDIQQPIEKQIKTSPNGTAARRKPVREKQKPAKSAQKERTKTAKADKQSPEHATLEKMRGTSGKMVENMDDSLTVPTATSERVMPVRMLIEDRALINQQLEQKSDLKVSFTYIIAWAIVRALAEFPNMNNAFLMNEDGPHKVIPDQVNLGLAVDIKQDDGSRNLVVPNIKGADKMDFKEFLQACTELIEKARTGHLGIDDFQNTTITFTNPGMIGTVSSVPRLMKGQGAIIAAGAIDYPAEFRLMSKKVLSELGLNKVMTMTSTYDHRIIQGAESGAFLDYIYSLLVGKKDFYDQIFEDLKIPYEPFRYSEGQYGGLLNGEDSKLEKNKRAIAVMNLINMYRSRGHTLADLDPLSDKPGHNHELDLAYYGLGIDDLDRIFYCGGLGGYEKAPLRTILDLLRRTYCGKMGVEYMHLQDLEERDWLREQMESTANEPQLDKADKRKILHKLNQALAFEQFLGKKYIGHKRFSLEGADSLIPMMNFLLDDAGEDKVEKIFMGMAHRGRLNTLVNIMHKPYQKVFADFEGNIDPESIQGSGDVKYHIGAKGQHKSTSGHVIDIELMSNPSHLESVDPVVEGASRATEDYLDGNSKTRKVLPVLVHGDASFTGQGVVAESLNMSNLEAYDTGGTVHIIINNQIGFTTLPKDGRSTQYPSDLAKMILAPIFHVNGDNPEQAVHAMKLAFQYRQKYGKDVVIDLICYRKHGHNEGDEPAFTQPFMYKEIDNHDPVRDIYTENLYHRGELDEDEARQIFDEFYELLDKAFEDAKQATSADVPDNMLASKEKPQSDWPAYPDTTYPEEEIREIAVKLNTVPKDFDANPKLLRQLAKRAEIVESNDKKIDWGFAEALSIGSLLKGGTTVRLTGQDAERGTFSHRHAILHGTTTDQEFIPLNNLDENQATFYPYNSLLSEYAALAFEFGYSAANLDALVIWEAQFGDFANGAQVPIDQYISASEAKWGQKSNLVMTLPHAYEGQGPEHSSARLERYLQLCAEDNMQVVNLTTPAQYFHILRKQAKQENKRPLIIMSPKSLLRHKLAVSRTEDLVNGSYQPFIPDETVENKEDIDRAVICSGKVYYDLFKYREKHDLSNVAIVRLEQFYPFPDQDVKQMLDEYSGVDDIVWCQEEPENMGAWRFARPQIRQQLNENQQLRYVGRRAAASPATGQKKIHEAEQELLIKQAMENKA